MSSFNINISDDDLIRNNLERIKGEIKDKINGALNTFGVHTVADAKTNSPIDEGHLRNSITFDKKELSVEVIVATDYAAYLEFGTRKFAAQYVSSLPPDWQAFAAKFKGGGGSGTFEEFVMRLTQWVLRKNIGTTHNVTTHRRDRVGKQSKQTTVEADAYAIALHILRNGIRPHKFLFPAVEKNKIELMKELNDIFK